MAYQKIAEQYVGDAKPMLAVFVADSSSDLTSIGTDYAAGSIAIIPGAKNYKLSPSGTWVQDV